MLCKKETVWQNGKKGLLLQCCQYGLRKNLEYNIYKARLLLHVPCLNMFFWWITIIIINYENSEITTDIRYANISHKRYTTDLN